MAADSDYADHFSHQNIPFGIASSVAHPSPQSVTRIENNVIFLSDLTTSGLLQDVEGLNLEVLEKSSLNALAALPAQTRTELRHAVQAVLRQNGLAGLPESCVERLGEVTMHLPMDIGDFTDTSCSLHHVRNAGRIITKSDKVPLNFFHFPLAYQGRTASIVPSGTAIERPWGHVLISQSSDPSEGQQTPTSRITYQPSDKVDYEVELAAFIGKPTEFGQCLTPAEAKEHIFGYVILNDWSARDIQAFEMMPLGPFNGKSLGTSISPWIITTDALSPFRVGASQSELPKSSPLYVQTPAVYDLTIEVEILSGGSATRTGKCHLSSLHWTPQQMVAHVTASGSPLRTGDLIATGTISGNVAGSHGCLLEATDGGESPLRLDDGSLRSFLQDGDIVRMTGFVGRPGSGVGFGECVAELVGAPSR